jgi:hypothetical protein
MSEIDFFGGGSSSSIDSFFSPKPVSVSHRIIYRVASESPIGFEKVDDDTLIRVSKQDFWKIGQDDEGYFVERLVDDASGPVSF